VVSGCGHAVLKGCGAVLSYHGIMVGAASPYAGSASMPAWPHTLQGRAGQRCRAAAPHVLLTHAAAPLLVAGTRVQAQGAGQCSGGRAHTVPPRGGVDG
jgi:hypothetical protein